MTSVQSTPPRKRRSPAELIFAGRRYNTGPPWDVHPMGNSGYGINLALQPGLTIEDVDLSLSR